RGSPDGDGSLGELLDLERSAGRHRRDRHGNGSLSLEFGQFGRLDNSGWRLRPCSRDDADQQSNKGQKNGASNHDQASQSFAGDWACQLINSKPMHMACLSGQLSSTPLAAGNGLIFGNGRKFITIGGFTNDSAYTFICQVPKNLS